MAFSRRLVAVSAVLAGLFALAPVPVAAQAGSLTVTPSEDVTPGQTVVLEDPAGFSVVGVCLEGTDFTSLGTAGATCSLLNPVTADGTSAEVVLEAEHSAFLGDVTFDCRVDSCIVGVADGTTLSSERWVPITMRNVGATLSATEVFDGDVVAVSAFGVRSEPGSFARVVQCGDSGCGVGELVPNNGSDFEVDLEIMDEFVGGPNLDSTIDCIIEDCSVQVLVFSAQQQLIDSVTVPIEVAVFSDLMVSPTEVSPSGQLITVTDSSGFNSVALCRADVDLADLLAVGTGCNALTVSGLPVATSFSAVVGPVNTPGFNDPLAPNFGGSPFDCRLVDCVIAVDFLFERARSVPLGFRDVPVTLSSMEVVDGDEVGVSVTGLPTGPESFARVQLCSDVGCDFGNDVFVADNGPDISVDLAIEARFTLGDGSEQNCLLVDCFVQVTVFEVDGAVILEMVSAPITVTAGPRSLTLVPSGPFFDGQQVGVVATGLLNAAASTAFVMQCAILDGESFATGFVCGPVGSVETDSGSVFEGSITVAESFVDGSGVAADCAVDRCLLAVGVLGFGSGGNVVALDAMGAPIFFDLLPS